MEEIGNLSEMSVGDELKAGIKPEKDAAASQKRLPLKRAQEGAKRALDYMKEKAVEGVRFVKAHKSEIAGVTAGIGALAVTAVEMKENGRLRAENEILQEDLKIERGVSDNLASRVNQLEDLCEEKDSYFKEMISDGLRHGSPLAGRHMVDRRQHLNGE